MVSHPFGGNNVSWHEVPVPADYDGDGKCDMAYLDTIGGRLTGNIWHIKESESGDIVTRTWDPHHADIVINTTDDFRHDARGDWAVVSAVPAPADYDGDGDAVPSVWQPKNMRWGIRGQNRVFIGSGLGILVTGDFDGDGLADKMLFIQNPKIQEKNFISNDITANGQWEGRHGVITVLEGDDGVYRMWGCTDSPIIGVADAVFYSESSSPTVGSLTQRLSLKMVVSPQSSRCLPVSVRNILLNAVSAILFIFCFHLLVRWIGVTRLLKTKTV